MDSDENEYDLPYLESERDQYRNMWRKASDKLDNADAKMRGLSQTLSAAHDKIKALEDEREFRRKKVLEVIESMTANHYVLFMVREAIEKAINGPCWTSIYESLDLEKEGLEEAISTTWHQFHKRIEEVI